MIKNEKIFEKNFITLVDVSSKIISINNIDDEDLLIEDLKTSAYQLAIVHQKQIETDINKMRWLTGNKFGIDSSELVIYCAVNNIRWMNLYYKVDLYGWFYRCDLAVKDENYQPVIINSPIEENKKEDKTFFSVLSSHSDLITTNDKLIWIYKILNKFRKNSSHNKLNKYRDIYLSAYKQGLVDFLKENDKKYDVDTYLGCDNGDKFYRSNISLYLGHSINLYYKNLYI